MSDLKEKMLALAAEVTEQRREGTRPLLEIVEEALTLAYDIGRAEQQADCASRGCMWCTEQRRAASARRKDQ